MAYGNEFAQELCKLWGNTEVRTVGNLPMEPIPDENAVGQLVSSCFHASLATEEGRTSRFRVIVVPSEKLDKSKWGFVTDVMFEDTYPASVKDLVKLAPATPFESALIAVNHDRERLEWRIVGLVFDDSDWWQGDKGKAFWVGGLSCNALTISVAAPGSLTASVGSRALLRLRNGVLEEASNDVYSADWLWRHFDSFVGHMHERLKEWRAGNEATKCEVMPEAITTILYLAIRSMVSSLRSAKHGGTVLFLDARESLTDQLLNVPCKYRYRDEKKRGQLGESIYHLFTSICQRPNPFGPPKWGKEEIEKYVSEPLDEHKMIVRAKISGDYNTFTGIDRITQVADAFASFGNIDGAVVLDNELVLHGFAGFVKDSLEQPNRVLRANDLEGGSCEEIPQNQYGSRHAAAFRFCWSVPSCLALVVSQDGSAKFVKRVDDAIVCWEQVGTGQIGA